MVGTIEVPASEDDPITLLTPLFLYFFITFTTIVKAILVHYRGDVHFLILNGETFVLTCTQRDRRMSEVPMFISPTLHPHQFHPSLHNGPVFHPTVPPLPP